MTAAAKPDNSANPTALTEKAPKAERAYKDTLQLPQTAFPMRAGAATREPQLQQFWDEIDVYHQALALRDPKHKFVLHDGPPYLSSDQIHIGTALNKILKDIITRYKTLKGFWSPYVPGYDGHGLPIEAAVEKKIKGGRRSVTPLELRQKCREFAQSNVKGQEANFRRLGVWGEWSKPYITIDGQFEATQIRLFQQMFDKGYVYKGLKPVYWCPVSETALAEAEIEYADHESHSIYVKFPILPSPLASLDPLPEVEGSSPSPVSLKHPLPKGEGRETVKKVYGEPLSAEQASALTDASFAIWTTTPWTLPANVAIAVNPALAYVVVNTAQWGKLVMAEALKDSVLKVIDEPKATVVASIKGDQLVGLVGAHPLIDGRESLLLAADFVTTDAGTGLVHIAPGHGPDDFFAVARLNRETLAPLNIEPLPVLSPIDSLGRFTHDEFVPDLVKGMFYEKANWKILDLLKERQSLLQNSLFTHSFPHSWRSHSPVMYRATEQWFINMDGFRDLALSEVAKTQWIPARGETRITTMVANRAEWCISRQRLWGVPIPAFYCAECGTVHLSQASTAIVADLFDKETSDAWAKYTADEILQGNITCAECGHGHFRKEEDVMDVWFDSGVTHSAVVAARPDELGPLPVELYLEGSDQHRGWFQSSLLTSVMVNEVAPYKAVLTHGFVLDETGRKMSKSLGNVIDPNVVMREYGADVLRLWVASVDYMADVRIGQNTLKQLADIYRKIRNTARFLLGNLHGFDPATQRQPLEQLTALDRYVLHRTKAVADTLSGAFDRYEFHRFYQVLQNFCVVELSSLYFDVVKDVLYCNSLTDPTRLGVQTVLYEVLSVLTRLIIPVMPHLAEDIWQQWPADQRPTWSKCQEGKAESPVSILLADWPDCDEAWTQPEAESHRFEALLALREGVNLALEEARKNEEIGSSLEASIILIPAASGGGETGSTAVEWDFLAGLKPGELSTLFLVSGVELVRPEEEPALRQHYHVLAEQDTDDGMRIVAVKALGAKCERCWQFCESVGAYADHPSLCHRCHEAVR